MLQVGVHDDDGAPARVIEAGRDGDLLAEVAAEAEPADARLARMPGLDRGRGVVLAAVVDEDDLPVRGDALQHCHDPVAQRADVGAFVIDRDDDADLDVLACHRLASCSDAKWFPKCFPALPKNASLTPLARSVEDSG
jgi:hypothetical protein